MGDLDAIRADFLKKRPDAWDTLPDLDLYMDQVISMLSRTQLAPEGSQKLTAAMVNNYVKEGLLPRSKGKRYDRDHLALLQIFVALKEIVTVKDAGTLLNAYTAPEHVADSYNRLAAMLGSELDHMAEALPHSESRDTLVESALRFALAAYANKMACLRLLEVINAQVAADAAEKDAHDKKKADKAADKKK